MVYTQIVEGTGDALKSVAFVIIVLCLVLFLAYLSTKWLAKKSLGGKETGNIEIIEKQYLSQDRSLIIVKVAGKTMLLGNTPQQITKLADLDASELITAEPVQQPDFPSFLKKAFGKGAGTSEEDSEK